MNDKMIGMIKKINILYHSYHSYHFLSQRTNPNLQIG